MNMVMGITAKDSKPGWIPEDLNTGHMDKFYFLIAALTIVDFVVYVMCAKWYKCVDLEGRAVGFHEQEGKLNFKEGLEDEVVNKV